MSREDIKIRTVLQGTVRYRDGRKWKKKYCVLTLASSISGAMHLYIGKSYEDFAAYYEQGYMVKIQASQVRKTFNPRQTPEYSFVDRQSNPGPGLVTPVGRVTRAAQSDASRALINTASLTCATIATISSTDRLVVANLASALNAPAPIDEVNGFESGCHVDKEDNIIMLIGNSSVHAIALQSMQEMFIWANALQKVFTDVHFRVTLRRTGDGSKLTQGLQGSLHIQRWRLCLVAEPAAYCKFITSWGLDKIKKAHTMTMPDKWSFGDSGGIAQHYSDVDSGRGIVTNTRHYFMLDASPSAGKGRGSHIFELDGGRLPELTASIERFMELRYNPLVGSIEYSDSLEFNESTDSQNFDWNLRSISDNATTASSSATMYRHGGEMIAPIKSTHGEDSHIAIRMPPTDGTRCIENRPIFDCQVGSHLYSSKRQNPPFTQLSSSVAIGKPSLHTDNLGDETCLNYYYRRTGSRKSQTSNASTVSSKASYPQHQGVFVADEDLCDGVDMSTPVDLGSTSNSTERSGFDFTQISDASSLHRSERTVRKEVSYGASKSYSKPPLNPRRSGRSSDGLPVPDTEASARAIFEYDSRCFHLHGLQQYRPCHCMTYFRRSMSTNSVLFLSTLDDFASQCHQYYTRPKLWVTSKEQTDGKFRFDGSLTRAISRHNTTASSTVSAKYLVGRIQKFLLQKNSRSQDNLHESYWSNVRREQPLATCSPVSGSDSEIEPSDRNPVAAIKSAFVAAKRFIHPNMPTSFNSPCTTVQSDSLYLFLRCPRHGLLPYLWHSGSLNECEVRWRRVLSNSFKFIPCGASSCTGGTVSNVFNSSLTNLCGKFIRGHTRWPSEGAKPNVASESLEDHTEVHEMSNVTHPISDAYSSKTRCLSPSKNSGYTKNLHIQSIDCRCCRMMQNFYRTRSLSLVRSPISYSEPALPHSHILNGGAFHLHTNCSVHSSMSSLLAPHSTFGSSSALSAVPTGCLRDNPMGASVPVQSSNLTQLSTISCSSIGPDMLSSDIGRFHSDFHILPYLSQPVFATNRTKHCEKSHDFRGSTRRKRRTQSICDPVRISNGKFIWVSTIPGQRSGLFDRSESLKRIDVQLHDRGARTLPSGEVCCDHPHSHRSNIVSAIRATGSLVNDIFPHSRSKRKIIRTGNSRMYMASSRKRFDKNTTTSDSLDRKLSSGSDVDATDPWKPPTLSEPLFSEQLGLKSSYYNVPSISKTNANPNLHGLHSLPETGPAFSSQFSTQSDYVNVPRPVAGGKPSRLGFSKQEFHGLRFMDLTMSSLPVPIVPSGSDPPLGLNFHGFLPGNFLPNCTRNSGRGDQDNTTGLLPLSPSTVPAEVRDPSRNYAMVDLRPTPSASTNLNVESNLQRMKSDSHLQDGCDPANVSVLGLSTDTSTGSDGTSDAATLTSDVGNYPIICLQNNTPVQFTSRLANPTFPLQTTADNQIHHRRHCNSLSSAVPDSHELNYIHVVPPSTHLTSSDSFRLDSGDGGSELARSIPETAGSPSSTSSLSGIAYHSVTPPLQTTSSTSFNELCISRSMTSSFTSAEGMATDTGFSSYSPPDDNSVAYTQIDIDKTRALREVHGDMEISSSLNTHKRIPTYILQRDDRPASLLKKFSMSIFSLRRSRKK